MQCINAAGFQPATCHLYYHGSTTRPVYISHALDQILLMHFIFSFNKKCLRLQCIRSLRVVHFVFGGCVPFFFNRLSSGPYGFYLSCVTLAIQI